MSSNPLKVGMRIERVFAVRKLETKTSKNGKPYLDIIFFEKDNEISAKLWDIGSHNADMLRKSLFLLVKGSVESYNQNLQIRVDSLEACDPSEEEIVGLIEVAPFSAQYMYGKIIDVLTSMENESLKTLSLAIYQHYQKELLYYPAAKSFHHSMKGGLLYHTFSMISAAAPLFDVYKFLSRDLLNSGIALHDIGKLIEMQSAEYGIVGSYTDEGKLLGHITSGIVLIDRFARQLGTDENELLLLKHMIISHHGTPEYGSPKPPMVAEAEALHLLDMLDSRMNIFERALSHTKQGDFSAKAAALDFREIYSHGLGEANSEGPYAD